MAESEYSVKMGQTAPCPCTYLNYGTKRNATYGCPICHGKTTLPIAEYERFYLRYVAELQGSGEFDFSMSQPPTLPLREQPMRLRDILAPNGSLVNGRAAMQTAGHVTYWAIPAEHAGQFTLLVKPYAPKEIGIRYDQLIPELDDYAAKHLNPHPHHNGWLARDLTEVGHGR